MSGKATKEHPTVINWNTSLKRRLSNCLLVHFKYP